MAKMFFKTFIFLLTFVVGAVHSIHDPTYTGIKTRSYQRDPEIAKALEQQRSSARANQYQEHTASSSYQPTKIINTVAVDEGLSQVNNNRYNTQYDHRQYTDDDNSYQHALPIYERNFQERHAASSNWDDAENVITEYYTGCPADHTGQLPYAYDCRRFLNCWKGRGHIQTCAAGTVFNPQNLECDRPDKVVCGAMDLLKQAASTPLAPLRTTKSANYHSGRLLDDRVEQVPVLCPTGAAGLQPHPTDCTKFINCDNGNVHVQSCGPGTAYDAKMMVCDFKDKVDCSSRQSSGHSGVQAGAGNGYRDRPTAYANSRTSSDNAAVVCPHDAAGLYPHPYDCTKFLNCANGITNIQDCGPGTAFDSIKRVCDYKAKVHCGTGNEHGNVGGGYEIVNSYDVTNQGFWQTTEACPLSMNGFHLYPYDCAKYISCNNGQMSIVSCAPGTVFSLQRKACLSQQEVEIWDRVQHEMEWRSMSSSHVTQSSYARTQSTGGIVLSCPTPNGFYIYPFDCAKYFRCQDGNIILKTCEVGSVFNFARKHCDLRENVAENERVAFGTSYDQNFAMQTVNGNTQSATFTAVGYLTCPAAANGLYLHPFDCSAFIRCTSGVTQLDYCPTGSVFSISKKYCVTRDQVDAYDRVEYNTKISGEFSETNAVNVNHQYNGETVRCPSNFNGLLQHPKDCGKYLECSYGQATIKSCAPGMVFSISKKSCDLPQNVEATDRSSYSGSATEYGNNGEVNYLYDFTTNSYFSTTITSSSTDNTRIVCPRFANGNYPHPYDYKKFLNCANGRTRIHNCFPNMVFSNSRKTCDQENNVDTSDRGPYVISGAVSGSNGVHDYGQSTSTSTTSSTNSGLCPPGSNGVTFHPHDCTKFLHCANGVTHINNCGTGTAWNNERQSCDFIHKVNCTGRQASLNQYGNARTTEINYYGSRYDNAVVSCPAGLTGRFPHPFDCTKYINCMNGQRIIQNCIAGTVYSISKKFCELKEHVEQTDRVSFVHEYGHELMSETANGFSQTALDPDDISCPPGATSFFLHPFDPTLYLKCENERAVVYACLDGMVFSISRKLCFTRGQVESTDQVTYLTYTGYNQTRQSKYNSQATSSSTNSDELSVTCPTGAVGLLPHPYDCKKFLNCANGQAYILDCGPGTAWNTITKLCDFENKVDCTNREIYGRAHANGATAVTAQCPAGQNGVYPHPFDCTKFLQCDNGRTHIQDCGPGTAWSSAMEVCDFIDKVDCAGRSGINTVTLSSSSSTSSTSVSNTNTQLDYESNHSNRDGKSYSNAGSRVNNWDHQPTGSTDQSWNYQQQHGYDANTQTTHYRPQTGYGPTITTTTATPNYQQGGDRWSNMHMSRPNPSTSYNPQTHYYAGSDTEGQHQVNTNWEATGSRPGVVHNPAEQGQYSGWSGTGSSIHRQSPTHTVIYEEGSLQPNSNYPQIVRKYSTPLAPFSPITTSTTTTTTTPTSYYYAQPVGSQEDSEETFTNIAGGDLSPLRPPTGHHQPSVPTHHSNRPQHGRDFGYPDGSNDYNPNIHTANTPNTNYAQQYPIPIMPMPNQNLMPPYPNNTKQITPSYTDHRTPTYRQPTDNTISETVNVPVTRLMPPHRGYTPNITNINLDNLPGTPFILNSSNPYGGPPAHFGQPAQSYPNYNTEQLTPTYTNDETNLYGGLQPPVQTPTEPTTTPNPYLRTPTYPTTPIQTSNADYDEPERKAHVYQIYPPIKGVPVQRFPNEPHYSSPYSGVAHSRNTSWPNTGIKSPPQSYNTPSAAPSYEDTFNRNPSNQDTTDTRTPVNYNRQYYKPAITPTNPNNSNDLAMQQLPISQALRMLLRPYFNRSGTVDDDIAAKAESHIMNLASKSHTTNSLTTTSTTSTTTSTTTTTTTTKRPNAIDMDGNEKDVELIFAGEQHSLVEVPTQSGGTTNTVHTNFHAAGHNWQITGQGSSPRSPHENSNWHNRDYHQNHPNLPNPFNGEERSSSANPHRNWHNHQHNHRHNHEHSTEFHKRHPNIPNPFETTTIVNNSDDPEYIPNPWAESTTPKNLYSDGGFGNKECPFDCGNGKCVQESEVCDGVNNCGNRKDESQCDHLGYEVRLAGGDASNLGRIEVKVLGKWGYVCDDKFGLRDADVVCKELGFKLGASEVRGNSFWAPNETNISFVMDEVECGGNEISLKDCNHKGWGVNNCRMDEIVGVVCKVPLLKCPNNYWLCSTSKECIPPAFVCDNTPDCADQSDESEEVCNSPIAYRLEGGRSSNEGRLEVMYRNVWGTVCDDDFGLNEGKVLCNSLGFYGTPKIEKNIYGPGSGPIWLDQVACLGNETSLDKCNHWTWGEHNCNHTEDVGIKCTVGPPPRKTPSGSGSTQGSAGNENSHQSEEVIATTLEDIGVYSSQWERSSKHLPDNNQKRCGHFKNDIVDEYEHPEERVVNGTAAKRGHHPWQATIRTKGRGGISSHWCGAVLISKKHLLTAAHCLVGYPKGAYFIRTGDHYANIAEASETDSYIENWYIHEKFRDSTHMNNDIALIVLKHPVRFNDYIQPICLPEKGASLQVNRMCTISGWGSIKSGVSTPSNILRAAQLPILSDETCKQAHVYGTSMTEGMFCAGSMDESVDACDGDSGGPLVCSDEDGETLYGIISWGQQCGFANKPGVYVRVEKYIDWIYEKINFSLQQGGK